MSVAMAHILMELIQSAKSECYVQVQSLRASISMYLLKSMTLKSSFVRPELNLKTIIKFYPKFLHHFISDFTFDHEKLLMK